jgi:cytochrome c biogenesis protein CcdA/thiol-disulfide isomerase/thioredoxin
VLVLLGIGFLAGVVTSISPCVLPVLPILLAGGASGRKPFRIITGLIASFVVFTLFASWTLRKLGLPQDLLRNLAIALLFLVAATLLVPRLGTLLERPFAALTRHRASGGGFVLGISLGLVFVPCAGPVLAAITVVAANNHVGWRIVSLTIAYALGAAVPMLLIALGGRGVATRLRAEGPLLRLASGAVIGLVALGIAFHVDDRFTTALPGYTSALQKHIEDTSRATKRLAKLTGSRPLVAKKTVADGLPNYGRAPALVPTGDWFNSRPLTIAGLRGKVVLVDFWTYSCVNCLRTLPHLKAWYATYHPSGLEIIGVHTPEFAFEHVASNVADAIKRFGIRYPVVQDNDYKTFTAYRNDSWPAEYLIDRHGTIRDIHIGEGQYGETEDLIRRLLGVHKLKMTDVPDLSPRGFGTPESYLGYERLERYVGSPIHVNVEAKYRFPRAVPQNELAYAGSWNVQRQRIVAGANARLRLHFVAQHVYLVLGGRGHVSELVDGKPYGSVHVDSYRLYTLLNLIGPEDATLELRFTPGVQAYAFTFG